MKGSCIIPELFNFISKLSTMKKIIFAALCSVFLLGASVGYSQDSAKAVEKGAKAMKKEAKGKHKKALKKTYKMEKKDIKDK